jgi:hypothetical protein
MQDLMFVDLDHLDFHLQADSACIDAGESLAAATDDYDQSQTPVQRIRYRCV